jgi:hypothetical protein
MPTLSLIAKHAELDAHNAKLLAQFAREVGFEEPGQEPRTIRRELTKPGDPRVLRAIPVIARGIGGTIPGTQPHSALR